VTFWNVIGQLADFDNIDEDNDKDDNNPWDIIDERDEEAAILPESQQLSMPSTWTTNNDRYRETGFTLHFSEVELTLHMNQADSALKILWETIADKSFQYSHVICVTPRQVIRTRAHTAIAKLNHTIASILYPPPHIPVGLRWNPQESSGIWKF